MPSDGQYNIDLFKMGTNLLYFHWLSLIWFRCTRLSEKQKLNVGVVRFRNEIINLNICSFQPGTCTPFWKHWVTRNMKIQILSLVHWACRYQGYTMHLLDRAKSGIWFVLQTKADVRWNEADSNISFNQHNKSNVRWDSVQQMFYYDTSIEWSSRVIFMV